MLLPALPPQPIPLCVAAVVVIAASTDITARRIPNPLIVIGLAASLLVHLWLDGVVPGAGNWLAGGLMGFALLIPLYLVRGTSAGDVKLLLTIGTWVGPAMILAITLVAFVIGGVWSVIIVVRGRHLEQALVNLKQIVYRLRRRTPEPGSSPDKPLVSVGSMPYGVAIAAGTLTMLFAANA